MFRLLLACSALTGVGLLAVKAIEFNNGGREQYRKFQREVQARSDEFMESYRRSFRNHTENALVATERQADDAAVDQPV